MPARARCWTRFPAGHRWALACAPCSRSGRWVFPSRARTPAGGGCSTRAATTGRTSRCCTCATAPVPSARWSTSTRDKSDGTRAIDWWFPSDDGARVAYGTSDGGSEESTLRVRDVASGRDLPDAIPRTRACSLAWTPDGAGFYYTRYPRPGQVPAGRRAVPPVGVPPPPGRRPGARPQVFGDGRDKTDWPNVDLSPDGRWLAIAVSQGWSKSELWLLDRQGGGTPPVPVAVGEEARFDVVETRDDRLYVLTTSGAPRGRIVAIDPRQPQRAHWRDIVPAGQDVAGTGGLLSGRAGGRLALRRRGTVAPLRRRRTARR